MHDLNVYYLAHHNIINFLIYVSLFFKKQNYKIGSVEENIYNHIS